MKREILTRWFPIAYLAVVAGLMLHADAAETLRFKVIVHGSNPMTSITKKELSNVYLKKQSSWSSGKPISPVDLPAGSATRAEFSKEVLKKSMSAVKAYWQQQIFAGKSVPPMEMEQAEAIEHVQKNPAAIAYVAADASTPGVKVLTVSEK